MTATQLAPSAEAPNRDPRFEQLDRVINLHQRDGHALIEVLHTAQHLFGYLPTEVLRHVAHGLKRPLSQVYGVASFYHFFRLQPPGEHTFVLCLGTACYAKGAPRLKQAVERRSGARFGQTTADGKVTLLTARCVGSCGVAPLALVDDTVASWLTEARAHELLDGWLGAEAAP
jgi:bidirectional [NiFe] hydrogenase diaphorase subunit